MHQPGYAPSTPIFQFHDYSFGMQVFTTENVYEPDAERAWIKKTAASLEMDCQGLTWAGGQEKAAGQASIHVEETGDGVRFLLRATHLTEKIRRVKLLLKGIDMGKLIGLRTPENEPIEKDIPASGLILRYPNGWDGLYTPLIVLQSGPQQFRYFRSLDHRVSPKDFVILPQAVGCDVELIYEPPAAEFRPAIAAPAWEIGTCSRLEKVMAAQDRFVQEAYHLERWEQRADVPGWMREISLVASIHGQHWTGYIYNTYEQMLETARWIGQRIDPRRVLVYLPGWEGRYYWQLGDYRPDPRMGGEQGFQRLVSETTRLGMHVMPMFMINSANPRHAGFRDWGETSLFTQANGLPLIWGTCDWDTSRHYNHDCQMPLNPGAPPWQDHLVGQINSLMRRYGFDAAFLDLAAAYTNDPRYDPSQGALEIARRIRAENPDALVAGEGWYDALSAGLPLSQPALTENPLGEALWPDRPYAPIFDRYNRCFGHLGQGDPGRGSTGVFEWGCNPAAWNTPLRRGIIPTITLVNDTLKYAPGKVEQVIETARQYARQFLEMGH